MYLVQGYEQGDESFSQFQQTDSWLKYYQTSMK